VQLQLRETRARGWRVAGGGLVLLKTDPGFRFTVVSEQERCTTLELRR